MADTTDRPHDPLDEYFDRLDKAFAALSASPRVRPAEPSGETAGETAGDPAGDPAGEATGEATGEAQTTTNGGLQITDALVDALTNRIIERLGPDSVRTVRAIVVQVVSEVAERLVREEIDRARHTHHV